jgi:hypothetical protein
MQHTFVFCFFLPPFPLGNGSITEIERSPPPSQPEEVKNPPHSGGLKRIDGSIFPYLSSLEAHLKRSGNQRLFPALLQQQSPPSHTF